MFFKNIKRICIADVTIQFIPLSYLRRKKRIFKIIIFNKERGNITLISSLTCVLLFGIVLKKYDGDSLLETLWKKLVFPYQRLDFKESLIQVIHKFSQYKALLWLQLWSV